MDRDEPDSEILERLRRRDEAVLPVLVAQYGGRIAAVVRGTWQGVADSDVEEVVADVVADAWLRAAEVDLERGRLEGWLVMRARYATLDRVRAARRRRSLVRRIAAAWNSGVTTPDYPSDLDAYLAGLTDLERTLIQFKFLEGQPVAEVAVTCGLTTKAAEHRLARLRNRLRERCVAALATGGPGHAFVLNDDGSPDEAADGNPLAGGARTCLWRPRWDAAGAGARSAWTRRNRCRCRPHRGRWAMAVSAATVGAVGMLLALAVMVPIAATLVSTLTHHVRLVSMSWAYAYGSIGEIGAASDLVVVGTVTGVIRVDHSAGVDLPGPSFSVGSSRASRAIRVREISRCSRTVGKRRRAPGSRSRTSRSWPPATTCCSSSGR